MNERIAIFGESLAQLIKDNRAATGVESALIMLMSDLNDPTDCMTLIVADAPHEEMIGIHLACFQAMALTLVKLTGKVNVMNAVSTAFAAADSYEEVVNPLEQLDGRPM